jgi:hypothetical protein
MAKTIKAEDYIGEYVKGVTLEACRIRGLLSKLRMAA